MKSKISKLFLALIASASLLAMSMPAEAWYRYHYWYGPRYHYYHYNYYHPYYNYYHGGNGCRWVPGHVGPYGGWHAGHRVCW